MVLFIIKDLKATTGIVYNKGLDRDNTENVHEKKTRFDPCEHL